MSEYCRPTRLLNPAAVAAADAAVMPQTGGRRIRPNETELRKQWLAAYIAAGGKYEVVKPSGHRPGETCIECPCTPIASIKIVSVAFRSDHAVLKDYTTDWDDGGTRYPKPEWTAALQYPVSHTMEKEVQIEVEYEVLPLNACPETGDLKGAALGGIVFKKSGVVFGPGRKKVILTTDKKLPKGIQEFTFAINWTTKGTSVPITPSQTANTMFVTMGPPTTPPAVPGFTLKRMRHAVSATGAAASLDPHVIVKHVMGKWSRFNLDQVYKNPWDLAADARDSNGDLIGADCQTIVRHTEAVIKMVGCPGKAEFIVVWAKVPTPAKGEENPAYAPNVANPKQWYNSFRPYDASKTSWRATLIDGDGNTNKYEACLRFTYPEGSTDPTAKKYYAGGVGRFENANQVIRVFRSMSWVDESTGIVHDAIYNY